MKKLVMVLTLLPLMAAAETEIVNGIKWTYTVRDGKAEIGDGVLPAIPSATTGALTIPSTLGGHPVTGIGDDAFAWCSGLTSVTIPEGVTSIGSWAFGECDGLKSVTIPSSVTSIAESAFFCRMLSSIIVKAGNRAYKIVNGCLLTWDGTVLIRGPSKDVVVVPEGVRVIASCAFFQCNLKSVSIPASVETIMCHDPRIFPEGGRAFDSCPQLASIRVDPANSFYKSENNCLLTKDGKVLLRGPSVVSATIPEGVEVIADEAFQDCEALVSVTIPSTVVKIGEWAFWWCKALSSLTIPASVQEVEPGFAECASLRFVRFLGAPPEFKWFEHDAEELALPIRYNSEYAEVWARVIEHYGFTDAEPYGGVFELVPGEKADFDTGLIGYAASGLPSGLKYNKTTGMITGAAKKPTAVEGVTVKFTKRNEPEAEMKIVVGPMPKLSISLEGDTEKCKVKGAGAYLVGKKVSLSATAPKGTAFTGWFANGAPWPNEADCRKAKLSYVMTKADVSLVAKFEKEKMSVGCAGLEGKSFTVGVAGAAGIPLEIETQSGVKSVKVSKLPAGMKYNAKTGLIEGAPTKAGDFTVQIAVTAKSGAVETKDIAIRVDPLPDWAVGTFEGAVRQIDYDADGNVVFDGEDLHDWYDIVATISVDAKGKISGKLTFPDKKTLAVKLNALTAVEPGICIAEGDVMVKKQRYAVRAVFGAGSFQFADGVVAMGRCDLSIILQGQPTSCFRTDADCPLVQTFWSRKELKGRALQMGLTAKSGFAVENATGEDVEFSGVVKVSDKGVAKLTCTVNGTKSTASGTLLPVRPDVADGFAAYVSIKISRTSFRAVKLLFVPTAEGWVVKAVRW